MNFTQYTSIIFLLFFSFLPAHAFERIDKDGAYESKTINGKTYSDRGKYKGLITSDGKMYDHEGQFIGKITKTAIIDKFGQYISTIRNGKIYDREGNYQGRIK